METIILPETTTIIENSIIYFNEITFIFYIDLYFVNLFYKEI